MLIPEVSTFMETFGSLANCSFSRSVSRTTDCVFRFSFKQMLISNSSKMSNFLSV